jgi:hypothetical protein
MVNSFWQIGHRSWSFMFGSPTISDILSKRAVDINCVSVCLECRRKEWLISGRGVLVAKSGGRSHQRNIDD